MQPVVYYITFNLKLHDNMNIYSGKEKWESKFFLLILDILLRNIYNKLYGTNKFVYAFAINLSRKEQTRKSFVFLCTHQSRVKLKSHHLVFRVEGECGLVYIKPSERYGWHGMSHLLSLFSLHVTKHNLSEPENFISMPSFFKELWRIFAVNGWVNAWCSVHYRPSSRQILWNPLWLRLHFQNHSHHLHLEQVLKLTIQIYNFWQDPLMLSTHSN